MFGEFCALSSRLHLPYITLHASTAVVLLGSTIGLETDTIFVDLNVMLQYNILIAFVLSLEAIATIVSYLRRSSAELILFSSPLVLYGYPFLFDLSFYRVSIFLLLDPVLRIWGFSSELNLKLFAIVIFCISILIVYSVWLVFNLTEQVIFSIAVWVVSLQLMRFITNIAFNHSVSSRSVTISESA